MLVPGDLFVLLFKRLHQIFNSFTSQVQQESFSQKVYISWHFRTWPCGRQWTHTKVMSFFRDLHLKVCKKQKHSITEFEFSRIAWRGLVLKALCEEGWKTRNLVEHTQLIPAKCFHNETRSTLRKPITCSKFLDFFFFTLFWTSLKLGELSWSETGRQGEGAVSTISRNPLSVSSVNRDKQEEGVVRATETREARRAV